MLSFEGYDVQEPLQQSDNHRAFKALRKLDNKPVIINFYQTDTSIYANLSHIKNIFHCLQEIVVYRGWGGSDHGVFSGAIIKGLISR